MLRKIRALNKHITIEIETLQQALKLINRHRKREQKVCCLRSDSSIQKLSVTQRVLNSRAWCHMSFWVSGTSFNSQWPQYYYYLYSGIYNVSTAIHVVSNTSILKKIKMSKTETMHNCIHLTFNLINNFKNNQPLILPRF